MKSLPTVQRGAALFVALIILLIVSMMGVSAMKSGIFNEKMAFNAQASDLSFQAAETAINSVISEARRSGTFASALFVSSTPVPHCLTRDQSLIDGVCPGNITFDQRRALYGEAYSKFDRKRVAYDNDTSAIMDFQFHTIGKGGFVDSSLRFQNRNLQEWRKLGPAGGPFSVGDQVAIGASAPEQPNGT